MVPGKDVLYEKTPCYGSTPQSGAQNWFERQPAPGVDNHPGVQQAKTALLSGGLNIPSLAVHLFLGTGGGGGS